MAEQQKCVLIWISKRQVLAKDLQLGDKLELVVAKSKEVVGETVPLEIPKWLARSWIVIFIIAA